MIAYEPIWAIGTGATRPRAGAGGDRVHPLAGRDRDEAAGDAVRILYGGSVKPDNAASCSAAGGRRGAGGRRQPRSGRLRRDRRAAREPRAIPRARPDLPVPSVALVVLDGWGLAPPGPETRSRWPRRRSSTTSGSATRTRAVGQRARRRPARRADGQLRGGAPQPGRRVDRQAGPDRGSTTRSPTAASSRTRRCSPPVRRAAPAPAGACT